MFTIFDVRKSFGLSFTPIVFAFFPVLHNCKLVKLVFQISILFLIFSLEYLCSMEIHDDNGLNSSSINILLTCNIHISITLYFKLEQKKFNYGSK